MLPVSGLQRIGGRVFSFLILSTTVMLILTGCEQMWRPAQPITDLHDATQPFTQPATRPSAAVVELTTVLPPHDPFLGQGDEIEVKVFRQEDLLRQILVPPSRVINYPLVGDVDVHNMTTNDLRAALTVALAPYVKDPQVSVRLAVSRSLHYSILGEVMTPGQFDLLGEVNAIQAVTKAGGFTPDARRQVVLLRQGTDKTNAFILDLGQALTDGDLRANIPLASGDIIYVPLSNVANVDRFSKHIVTWLQPILSAESAVVLGQAINTDFGNSNTNTNINVITQSH